MGATEERFFFLSERIKKCDRCNLHRGIRNYVPGILGIVGNSICSDLVFVGEAPGALEDITGEPFVGNSGSILTATIREKLGLERGQYTILNSVKCRPPENRQPTDKEKKRCRPWLLDQLRIVKPKIIITLGSHAAHAILGIRAPMHELRENFYVVSGYDMHVVPTYHPMATVYVRQRRAQFDFDISTIKDRKYQEVRRNERCSIPIDAPQDLDGSGTFLPPPTP